MLSQYLGSRSSDCCCSRRRRPGRLVTPIPPVPSLRKVVQPPGSPGGILCPLHWNNLLAPVTSLAELPAASLVELMERVGLVEAVAGVAAGVYATVAGVYATVSGLAAGGAELAAMEMHSDPRVVEEREQYLKIHKHYHSSRKQKIPYIMQRYFCQYHTLCNFGKKISTSINQKLTLRPGNIGGNSLLLLPRLQASYSSSVDTIPWISCRS